MTEIDLDRVVALLRERGVDNPHVAHTGGGCATLYAGPTLHEPCDGCRWAVVAGPGRFAGPGYTLPYADCADLFIGADDDGATEPVCPPDNATDDTVAAIIAAYLDGRTCRYCGELAAYLVHPFAGFDPTRAAERVWQHVNPTGVSMACPGGGRTAEPTDRAPRPGLPACTTSDTTVNR